MPLSGSGSPGYARCGQSDSVGIPLHTKQQPARLGVWLSAYQCIEIALIFNRMQASGAGGLHLSGPRQVPGRFHHEPQWSVGIKGIEGVAGNQHQGVLVIAVQFNLLLATVNNPYRGHPIPAPGTVSELQANLLTGANTLQGPKVGVPMAGNHDRSRGPLAGFRAGDLAGTEGQAFAMPA